MTSISLGNLYSQMQQEMQAKLNVCSVITNHPGTKGDKTELDWISWFRDYLPKRYEINKGIIVDSSGEQSDQIDIIIYDAHYSHLVFHHEETILVPAESVYAALEVKPALNKGTMEYASKKIKSVRKLTRYSASIPHAGGIYKPKPLHEIIGGLVTTRSDWKSPLAPNVKNYIYGADKEECLDLVCSISDGTFSVDREMLGENIAAEGPIKFCEADVSLVFLLLSILTKLQAIGTAPAIDFPKYAESIQVDIL